jgi:CheY-like chemotaxis protein
MMPEMDGPSFYEELIKRQPAYQERLLFITGAAKGEVSEALKATERPVLNKPITRAELYSALEGLKG